MSPPAELLVALELDLPCEDEEIASTLVALLTSAVHDSNPEKSLEDLHHLMTSFGGSAYMDPLNMLPLLLPCPDPTATELLSLLAECGSPKEMIIAVEEASERLQRTFEAESVDDGRDCDWKDQIRQTLTLMSVLRTTIPKLKLRRRTASETIKPIFRQLDALLATCSGFMSRPDHIEVIGHAVALIDSTRKWASEIERPSDDAAATRLILVGLLERLTTLNAPGLDVSIAKRTFEECFPRLVLRSSPSVGWKEDDEAIFKILDVFNILGPSSDSNGASTRSLISAAFRPSTDVKPQDLLAGLLPVLISSLQTNTLLEESLAVLLRSLHSYKLSDSATIPLPSESTIPLLEFLPSIASVHPDPQTRHYTFRVLSLLLSACHDQLRFQLLSELAGSSEFPQMRVAAVGLVKESVLQALGQADAMTSSRKPDPLVGPMFLRTFGPILFRPNPPDLFGDQNLHLETFQESFEPARLVECLALYYVLYQRDAKNLTGIRDIFKTVNNNLSKPLETHLDRWMASTSHNNPHISPLVSLSISIDRVKSLQ